MPRAGWPDPDLARRPRRRATDLPPLGSAADPAFKTRRFGKTVACHYTFMHENLMDMNHQFLHRKQMGQIAPRYLGRRVGEDWMEIDYTFARTGGKQPLGEAAIMGVRRGTSTVSKDLMTIRTEYPYQVLRIWTSGDEPVMHLWICYTPVDAAQKINRTFGLLSIRRPEDSRLAGCGLAGAGLVHRAHLPRGPRDRGNGTAGARLGKALIGTRRCFRRSATCAPCWPRTARRSLHA